MNIIADKIDELRCGFLSNTGWIKSYELESCVDGSGDFIPWYSYCMIDFLKERLNNEISVFEFGCGYSTLFYAKRCAKVIGLETRQIWADKINLLGAGLNNFEIKIASKDFSSGIDLFNEKFGIVVIDSVDRYTCAVSGYNNLAKNGVVILDNSDRDKYTTIFDFFTARGFKKITFSGIGPLRTDISYTTIFYRSNNILGL